MAFFIIVGWNLVTPAVSFAFSYPFLSSVTHWDCYKCNIYDTFNCILKISGNFFPSKRYFVLKKNGIMPKGLFRTSGVNQHSFTNSYIGFKLGRGFWLVWPEKSTSFKSANMSSKVNDFRFKCVWVVLLHLLHVAWGKGMKSHKIEYSK